MPHSKQGMSNLDYFYLLKEIAPQIEGARLDGAYDYFGGFRLRFRKEGMQYNLAIELGVRMHLTSRLPESPKEPSSFVKLLREQLDNAVLEKISLVNFDRIVSLKFSRGRTLIFEQLGKGNSLVLDESGKIVRPMRGEEFSSRKLRKGETYCPPPNEKVHPLQINNLELSSSKPTDRAVGALSRTLNLPPFYLDEALARAGFPKTSLVSEVGLKTVLQESKNLLEQSISATAYFDAEGSPAAYAPFHLKKFEGEALVAKSFPSFCEALEEYYSGHFDTQMAGKDTAKVEQEKDSLQGALEQQKKALERMIEEEKEARLEGEWIYSNYSLVEAILMDANEASNRKIDEKQASELMSKKHGMKITLKKSEVEIEALTD